jgi:hypothetical protein
MANSHICSGRTIPGNTLWQTYAGGKGIYVDIDTTTCNFSSIPVYITSIGGNGNHWGTTGATSVYLATKTGFRIYVRWVDYSTITPASANQLHWHINWIAMAV